MGEIALTISKGGVFTNLSELPDLDETAARQVLKIAVIKTHHCNWVKTILGAPEPHSYTELGIMSSMIGHTGISTSLAYFSSNFTKK